MAKVEEIFVEKLMYWSGDAVRVRDTGVIIENEYLQTVRKNPPSKRYPKGSITVKRQINNGSVLCRLIQKEV